jgi:hypothetical protein
VTVTEPIKKLMLAQQHFVNNWCTDFDGNQTNRRTDGHNLYIRCSIFISYGIPKTWHGVYTHMYKDSVVREIYVFLFLGC